MTAPKAYPQYLTAIEGMLGLQLTGINSIPYLRAKQAELQGKRAFAALTSQQQNNLNVGFRRYIEFREEQKASAGSFASSRS